MSSLSSKTVDELSTLLDEYGISHGPIVDSTRKLYEKKLAVAMAKNAKPPSDKTFYREEEEEITYVTYHPPVKHTGFGDVTRRSKTMEYAEDEDHANEPVISYTQTTYQNASTRSSYTSKSSIQSSSSPASDGQAKSEGSKSGGVPGWLRVLVFIIIALMLYLVYLNMETAEESPFNMETAEERPIDKIEA